MPNVAKITIAGHAGRDAELRYLQDGTAVCDFSVAVNGKGKDKELTTWYKVTVWRKYGEIMKDLVKKGVTVTVIGDFQPRTYTDNSGAERVSYDITATDVIVFGQADSNGTPHNVTKGEFTKGAGKLNPEGDDIPF